MTDEPSKPARPIDENLLRRLLSVVGEDAILVGGQSPKVCEAILDHLDDARLTRLAKERLKQKHRSVEVTLDEL